MFSIMLYILQYFSSFPVCSLVSTTHCWPPQSYPTRLFSFYLLIVRRQMSSLTQLALMAMSRLWPKPQWSCNTRCVFPKTHIKLESLRAQFWWKDQSPHFAFFLEDWSLAIFHLHSFSYRLFKLNYFYFKQKSIFPMQHV